MVRSLIATSLAASAALTAAVPTSPRIDVGGITIPDQDIHGFVNVMLDDYKEAIKPCYSDDLFLACFETKSTQHWGNIWNNVVKLMGLINNDELNTIIDMVDGGFNRLGDKLNDCIDEHDDREGLEKCTYKVVDDLKKMVSFIPQAGMITDAATELILDPMIACGSENYPHANTKEFCTTNAIDVVGDLIFVVLLGEEAPEKTRMSVGGMDINITYEQVAAIVDPLVTQFEASLEPCYGGDEDEFLMCMENSTFAYVENLWHDMKPFLILAMGTETAGQVDAGLSLARGVMESCFADHETGKVAKCDYKMLDTLRDAVSGIEMGPVTGAMAVDAATIVMFTPMVQCGNVKYYDADHARQFCSESIITKFHDLVFTVAFPKEFIPHSA